MAGTHGAAIQRERLSPVHAALACVRFSKLGALGGGAVGAAVLDRAGSLTKAVPVYVAARTAGSGETGRSGRARRWRGTRRRASRARGGALMAVDLARLNVPVAAHGA